MSALAVVLAAAAVGAPPIRAGHAFLCPQDAAVAAYSAPSRLAYPPLHPRRPDASVPIARCFPSLTAARRAGFRDAPTPPGDVVLDGIYLVPVGAATRDDCRTAAAAAGFPVPCPGLLPALEGQGQPSAAGGFEPGFGFSLMAWGSAPPTYLGDAPGSIHLVFAASRSAASPYVRCRGGVPVGAARLGGIFGALMPCPPGSETNGGHLLFRWRRDGVTYVVSAHGHTRVNRSLLRVLLAHLSLVGSS